MNLHFFGSGSNKSACFVLNSAQRGPDSVVKYSGKVGCCQWCHHCNHYWGDYCYPRGDHRPPRLITWLLAVPLGTWPGDTKVSGPPSDLKKSSTSWKPSGVLMFPYGAHVQKLWQNFSASSHFSVPLFSGGNLLINSCVNQWKDRWKALTLSEVHTSYFRSDFQPE